MDAGRRDASGFSGEGFQILSDRWVRWGPLGSGLQLPEFQASTHPSPDFSRIQIHAA